MSLALFFDNEKKFNAYEELSKVGEADTCVFVKEHFGKPVDCNFAVFDATEILNFTGSIVSDNIDNSLYVISSVCNCTLYHIYNKSDKRLMDLMKICSYKHVVFCCETEDDALDLKRKTEKINVKTFGSFGELLGGINDYKRIRNCQKI